MFTPGGVSALGMGSIAFGMGESGSLTGMPNLNASGMGIDSISEFRRQVINKRSAGAISTGKKRVLPPIGSNSKSSMFESDDASFVLRHEPIGGGSIEGGGESLKSQVRFASA